MTYKARIKYHNK